MVIFKSIVYLLTFITSISLITITVVVRSPGICMHILRASGHSASGTKTSRQQYEARGSKGCPGFRVNASPYALRSGHETLYMTQALDNTAEQPALDWTFAS